jgi:cytoskeleton protein RodZ
MTEAIMTGVGQELAAAREARGLALADVSQSLKFAPRQLEALEQEHFEALPGATFARGMVRSYARLLKLDPEPLLQRIAGRFEIPDSNRLAARYHQPVPFSNNARRWTFVYAGVSLAVLGLVGAFAYEWHQERTAAAKAPKATSVAKAVPREVKRPIAPVPVQPAAAPVVTQEKIQEKIQERVQEKPVIQEKTIAAPAATPRPGAHRLVVRTDGEAWIEIKDSADRMLVSSLNPAGSERVVRGKPPYNLVIGNASQVRITYDDKPVDLAPHTRQDVARLTLP